MTDEEAITRIMTCASDVHCKREEACFVVATRLKELLDKSKSEAVPDHDPDTVAHYAPDWENSRVDWSAS